MKHLKFISVILLFLLSFSASSEFYNYHGELSSSPTSNIVLDSVSSTLSMSNDVEMHFVVKKKMKTRVASSYSSIIKNYFYTKLIHFKTLRNTLIYSITTIYHNQGQTHLHLYQLFQLFLNSAYFSLTESFCNDLSLLVSKGFQSIKLKLNNGISSKGSIRYIFHFQYLPLYNSQYIFIWEPIYLYNYLKINYDHQ